MQIIEKKRLAIHEASHALVVKLFGDQFDLKFVTISPEKIKKETPELNDVYGLNGADFIGQNIYCTGFVSLAGIVGEKISKDGRDKVLSEKKNILENPNQMDRELGKEDLESFERYSGVCFIKYRIDRSSLEQTVLGFLIDFLCNEHVWNVVEDMAEILVKTENETLEQEELNQLFEDSGLNKYLKNNKERLLKETELHVVDENTTEDILKKFGITDNDVDLAVPPKDCDTKREKKESGENNLKQNG